MESDWPDFAYVDWKDLYPRLLLATEGRLRRIPWRGQFQASVPGGFMAADFVQQAIQKAKEGKRSWDPTRTLFENFWQIISSDISHLVKSYENKNVDIEEDHKIVNLYTYKIEEEIHHKLLIEKYLSYIGSNDAEARSLAALMIHLGMTKSIELSVQLRKPVSEIENIKKRLRRLTKSYQSEHEVVEFPKQVAASSGGDSK